MQTTKNKLSPNLKHFFNQLISYINCPIYFYGSIQRNDYIPGKSDIDVDIFTDNETSTMYKLIHFLKITRKHFKNIVWKIRKDGSMVYGYKVSYKRDAINEKENIEFSVYNEKYKNKVLDEHNSKVEIPFVASLFLYILKTLYYNFNLLNKNTFKYLKNKVLNSSLGLDDDLFAVL